MDQDREEDSGLHDIRNLAQSTKQRLSSRRITSPPVADDILAGASGSFKNIALPQPAKMVSLPSVDELPSKAEIAAAEKAAKEAAKDAAKKAAKEAKETRASKPEVAAIAPAAPAIETPVAAPVAAVPARSAFTLPSQQRKGSKGPVLAIVGLGLAAAAGGFFYLQMNNKDKAESAAVATDRAPAAQEQAAAITAAPIETGAAGAGSAAAAPAVVEAPPPAEPAKAEAAPVEAQIAADNVKDAEEKADAKKKTKPAKGGKTKVDKEETPKVEETKPADKPDPKKQPTAAKGGEEGEPSFDALLKEAGVDGAKKEVKPKLDKKSLTSDDFKKGMSAPAGKAKGCYKGTQGTAMVKLTVSPSGSISKLTVTGDFAGKPEGACVESALKSASFPPWDGGPQSFTYSVLLSD